MTPTDRKCKIDGVAVGEASLNLLGPVPVLAAKFALVGAESQSRFGAGNMNAGWSQETMERLAALVSSMEADLLNVIFDEGPTTTDSVVDTEGPQEGGVSGL